MRGASLVVLMLSTAAFAEKPRVAVLDLVSSNELASLSSAATGVAATELSQLGVFEVTSSDEVRQLLARERQRALTGTDVDDARQVDIGQSLEADYLLGGKLSSARDFQTGSVFTLELTLTESTKAARVSSVTVTAKSEAQLVTLVRPSVIKLCAPLLKGLSGWLLLNVGENGATVKVDGVIVATTPLARRLSLPGGPHLVEVDKEGFVSGRREIRIQREQLTEETITLMPSPDFVTAYETRARKMRFGAYALTAVSAISLGTAAYFQLRGDALYGAPDRPDTFAFHRALLDAGAERDDSGNHRDRANALKAQIQTAQTMTTLGVLVGASAAAGAAYLLVAGEPPGRYDRLTVTPIQGGVAAGISGAF